MNRKELKSLAKSQIKDNTAILWFLSFVSSICSSLLALLPSVYKMSFDSHAPVTTVTHTLVPFINLMSMLLVAHIVFAYPLSISFKHACLECADNKKVEMNMIKYGFKIWDKSILLGILTSVFTFLWSLLFIVPGIIKCYSYSQASYILAENPGLTALEAINKSKKMMKGHKFELFILQFSFFWWAVLVVICYPVSIYTTPYSNIAYTNFYNKIKEQNN